MIHILKSPARIDVNCSWFTGCKNSLHISCREPHISSPKKNNTRRIIFLKIKKKKQLDLSIIRAIYRRLAKSYFTYEGKQHYPRTNLTYHTINHKRGKIAVSQAMKKMPVRIGCRDKPPPTSKAIDLLHFRKWEGQQDGFSGSSRSVVMFSDNVWIYLMKLWCCDGNELRIKVRQVDDIICPVIIWIFFWRVH